MDQSDAASSRFASKMEHARPAVSAADHNWDSSLAVPRSGHRRRSLVALARDPSNLSGSRRALLSEADCDRPRLRSSSERTATVWAPNRYETSAIVRLRTTTVLSFCVAWGILMLTLFLCSICTSSSCCGRATLTGNRAWRDIYVDVSTEYIPCLERFPSAGHESETLASGAAFPSTSHILDNVNMSRRFFLPIRS